MMPMLVMGVTNYFQMTRLWQPEVQHESQNVVSGVKHSYAVVVGFAADWTAAIPAAATLAAGPAGTASAAAVPM